MANQNPGDFGTLGTQGKTAVPLQVQLMIRQVKAAENANVLLTELVTQQMETNALLNELLTEEDDAPEPAGGEPFDDEDELELDDGESEFARLAKPI